MNIFNSLGSNYNWKDILYLLEFTKNKGGEKKLKKYLANRYGGRVILTYKGREAMRLGLRALNLPQGAAVAINGYTCYTVWEAITKENLKPVYLDLKEGLLNFGLKKLKKAFQNNHKIKAVVVQNTLGYPADIKGIEKFCQENNLYLIEDLAHSVGAKYQDGCEAGTVGDIAVLSFGQDKIVDAVVGGALIVRRPGLELDRTSFSYLDVPRRRQLSDWFYPLFTFLIRKTYPIFVGKVLHKIMKENKVLSSPLGEFKKEGIHHLPLGFCRRVLKKYEKLEAELEHRRAIAKIYATSLPKEILLHKAAKSIDYSSNLRFPILIGKRRMLIEFLKQSGVYLSDIWYDAPIAPKRLLRKTDYREGGCPVSEKLSQEMFNLPTHINVSEKEALKIAKLVKEWLNTN